MSLCYVPVVQPFDFGRLQRVENQTDVTLPRQPSSVVLILRFAAEAAAVFALVAVPADIKHPGAGFVRFFGDVQIRRHIQSGPRLKVQLFHGELGVIDGAGHTRGSAASAPQRIKTEHFVQLPAQFILAVEPSSFVLISLMMRPSSRAVSAAKYLAIIASPRRVSIFGALPPFFLRPEDSPQRHRGTEKRG